MVLSRSCRIQWSWGVEDRECGNSGSRALSLVARRSTGCSTRTSSIETLSESHTADAELKVPVLVPKKS